MRVLFFGTHPYSTNGYSYVTVELAKYMATKKDVRYSVYGFQNFGNIKDEHQKARQWPENVYVYDAFANENPRQIGFGFDQVVDFVTLNKPDVVVIYNDMIVVSNILEKLKQLPDKTFKVIVYIDQVYLHQKKEHIKRLNEESDFVLAFTPYWEENVKKLGITKPTDYLCHGFSKSVHYPVPKQLARQYYGLKNDDFIIMNLNRNQPRKRWDTCLQAFAEVVSRHLQDPIKLLIATAMQGAWNLVEVYERELAKRGISLEEGMKHIIIIDNPQQLSDDEINILYNVADVGINTCDGEGFGLCNFQQAAIGIPQIVPKLGGFREFFNKDNAILVDPKMTLYVDASRDGVGGEAELCDWRDFADAIETYYSDDDVRTQHGHRCRQELPEKYAWKKIGERFYSILKTVVGVQENLEVAEEPHTISLKELENININDLDGFATSLIEEKSQVNEGKETKEVKEEQKVVIAPLAETLSVSTIVKPTISEEPTEPKCIVKNVKKPKSHGSMEAKQALRDRLKSKLDAKNKQRHDSNEKSELSKEELLAMKEKIDAMLRSL